MEALSEEDPRSVGEYELRGRLGKGGFGQVYLGLSPGGRAVAVKVLWADLARDPKFLQRFRFEVAAARQVNGLYTAQVVAEGLDDRPPWVATAFVPGPSLRQMVDANGPLPEAALWRLLAGLVEALQAIHGCNLVHRDLKPENVLIAADGPKVIDFGISKAVDAIPITSTGRIVGTPSYMAPEHAVGMTVGPAADVFSLGCVLAYAATGEPPFGRDGPNVALLYRITQAAPILNGVPPRLRAVIERCLAKTPQARPSLTELAKVGRDGTSATSGPLSLAFWPPPLGKLIKEYEGQFGDAQGIPEAPTVRPDPTADAAYGTTISARREVALPPADTEPAGDSSAGNRPVGRKRRGGRRWLPLVGAGIAVALLVATAWMLLSNGGGTQAMGSGPTASSTVKTSQTANVQASSSSSATASPSPSGTVTETGQASATATGQPTATATGHPSGTGSPKAFASPTATHSPTSSPSSTASHTVTSASPTETMVAVPDVYDDTQQAADSKLMAAGFKVQVSCGDQFGAPVGSGLVYAQSPASGTAPVGSTVTISVVTYAGCPAGT